jgi:4-hydroxythreonine-4-phosphate dehydrogenase
VPRLGLTLGDPTGIGPEVALKALRAAPSDEFEYVLLGDVPSTLRLNQSIGLDFGTRIRLEQSGPELPADFKRGNPAAAQCAKAALVEGARRCLSGELAGLVTAPVSKEAIIRLGEPFTGQTEFLSELAGAKRTAMMLLGCDDRERWLRVALVTTHLPLRAVADALTERKIVETIGLAAEACGLLGLPEARVAVCGLNPHAGEGGEIGREEIELIAPAVEKARRSGWHVEGPMPADTLFYYAFKGDFEAVVAMYHDQGLAPLKMIGFERGINWTLGLPFVRTSPDHGTAFDIAGQNKADPRSMIAALELAKRLTRAGQPPGRPAR